jgi:hypothetical protein
MQNLGQTPRSEPEPKGIFVFCDGTGNEFAAKDSPRLPAAGSRKDED